MLTCSTRASSSWRVLLVPTRALATGILFWLALLPPGLAKAALPGNVTLWHYHLDHLGTTHSITDASGNLYRQTRTAAYGEVRGRYDGSGNIVAVEVALRHEFTGYQSEEKSSLQYAGDRYYPPELGVFTSQDLERQFPSPYAYGPGDPVNTVDPDGTLSFWSILGAALFGISIGRAIEVGLKTGKVGLAFQSIAVDLAAAAAAYAIGGVIAASLQAISTALATAYQIARVGYTAYNFAQSIRKGDVFGAVTAGLSLLATAYGFLEDQYGSNTSKVVSGQGKEAKQVGQFQSGSQSGSQEASQSNVLYTADDGTTIATVSGGTAAEQKAIRDDLTRVFGTKRGQEMVAAIQERGFPVEVQINDSGQLLGDLAHGKWIRIDLGMHPNIQTTAGVIPAPTARILAHELGHAVFRMNDTGPGLMANVLANENPIAIELGEPARTRYLEVGR